MWPGHARPVEILHRLDELRHHAELLECRLGGSATSGERNPSARRTMSGAGGRLRKATRKASLPQQPRPARLRTSRCPPPTSSPLHCAPESQASSTSCAPARFLLLACADAPADLSARRCVNLAHLAPCVYPHRCRRLPTTATAAAPSSRPSSWLAPSRASVRDLFHPFIVLNY